MDDILKGMNQELHLRDTQFVPSDGVVTEDQVDQRQMDPGQDKEKRQLVVVFIDLADSTGLSTRLDLETFHSLISKFLKQSERLISLSGGFVARFMGDGLLAYFGYPEAGETDSLKAIEAALAIKSAIGDLSAEFGLPLAFRAGIAAGEVVLDNWLGDGIARERPVTGIVANLAARLQSAAPANSIYISKECFERAESAFTFKNVEQLNLKGLTKVTQAYEVIDEKKSKRQRWELDVGNKLRVKRLSDLKVCSNALADARQNKVVSLHISGEAGLGKTSLIRSFLEENSAPNLEVIWTAAEPTQFNSPFFLANQISGNTPFLNTQISRDMLLDQALDFFLTHSLATIEGNTTIIVIEDLHWADPSSIAFFQRLTDYKGPASILLIYTSRSEAVTHFPDMQASQCLKLTRFTDAEISELIYGELGDRVNQDIIKAIIKRANGVPLFARELSRLVSSSDNASTSTTIPTTLIELISARLGAMKPAFRFAQCLSVFGMNSDLEHVILLSKFSLTDAQAAVATLTRVNAIRAYADQGVQIIAFEHALVREAVYASLFDDDRRHLHLQVVTMMSQTNNHRMSSEALAGHWQACGEVAKAIECFGRAAQKHQQNRSFQEAEMALELGLDLLSDINSQSERNVLELELQSTLASVLQISLGYSNPRALTAATRARALGEKQGEILQKFGGVAGEWMAASSAGDFNKAQEKAQNMHALALILGKSELLASSWMALLTSRFRVGDLTGAEAAFAAGEKHFQNADFRKRPGAIAQTYGNAALVAALLGEASEGRKRAAFAIKNARKIASQFDISFSTYMAAVLALILGADRSALRLSHLAYQLASKNNFPQFSAIAQIVQGRALASSGEVTAGVDLIKTGISSMDQAGSRVGRSLYLGWLGEALCYAGKQQEALAALDLALTDYHQERFYRPELLRFKAILLTGLGQTENVDNMLLEAKDLATKSQGRWFLTRLTL